MFRSSQCRGQGRGDPPVQGYTHNNPSREQRRPPHVGSAAAGYSGGPHLSLSLSPPCVCHAASGVRGTAHVPAARRGHSLRSVSHRGMIFAVARTTDTIRIGVRWTSASRSRGVRRRGGKGARAVQVPAGPRSPAILDESTRPPLPPPERAARARRIITRTCVLGSGVSGTAPWRTVQAVVARGAHRRVVMDEADALEVARCSRF